MDIQKTLRNSLSDVLGTSLLLDWYRNHWVSQKGFTFIPLYYKINLNNCIEVTRISHEKVIFTDNWSRVYLLVVTFRRGLGFDCWMGRPLWIHLMSGSGTPDAWQLNCTRSPSAALIISGSTVKYGAAVRKNHTN